MSYRRANGNQSAGSPFLVEVIGLAGSGKSTLARALIGENAQYSLGPHLNVRDARRLPYMVRQAFLSLPTLLGRPATGRWLTRREMAKVLYLSGWHRVLKSSGDIVIVDQGPVYELATLRANGPLALRDPRHEGWWQQMFGRWARTIDLVIWLDAPMDLLIQRIRSREGPHPVKESATPVMEAYLGRYQAAYEFVMAELSRHHDLKVVRLDTGRHNMAEVRRLVESAIDPGRRMPVVP